MKKVLKIKTRGSPQPLKVIDTNASGNNENALPSPKGLLKRSRSEISILKPSKKTVQSPKAKTPKNTKKANQVTTALPVATLYETSVVFFEALSAIEKEEGSCVLVTPRVGEDFGSIQISAVADGYHIFIP